MSCIRRVVCIIVLLFPSFAFCADDPLVSIGQLISAGRGDEARVQILRVRDAYAAQSNAEGEAASWLLLAIADLSLKDPGAARINAEQAAAKFTTANDHFGSWFALWFRSELETSEGRYAEAIGIHERALEALRQAESPQARFSLETLTVLGPVFGASTDQLGPIAAYPELIKPILLQFAGVISRDAYGHALVEGGALEKAEQQLTAAAAASTLFGGLFDSSIAAHLGDLRARQWRLDEARTSYLKALEGVKLMPIPAMFARDPWIEVQILGKLASLESLSGRTDEALVWNERALKEVRASNKPRREASILQDRATLLQNGGRNKAAVDVLHDALKIAVANKDVFREATTQSDLGTLHFFQGNYGTALEHLEKSIELFQTLDEPYVEAPVWAVLAEVHLMLDAHDSAEHALDNAARLAKKSGFTLAGEMVKMLSAARKFNAGKGSTTEMDEAFRAWWSLPEAKGLMFNDDAQRVMSLCLRPGADPAPPPAPGTVATAGPPFVSWIATVLRGKMLMERGEFAEARAVWREALETTPGGGDHRAGILALLGTSYWKEGNAEEAIHYLEQAAATLEVSAADVKVEELLASYLGSNRRWYFDLLIDMLVHEGRTTEAFSHAERARARAFLQLVGNHRLNADRGADPKLTLEAETLRAEIEQRERQLKVLPRADAEQVEIDLRGARQRYRTLMIRAKVSNPEYAAMTTVEPLQVEAVQAQLPADTTLVSYFVSPNLVHAWVIDRTAIHYARLPLDEKGLRRITCWAAQYGTPTESRSVEASPPGCDEAATAEEAFAKLFAPLLEHVGNRKLVIVPHGVLHYVPFAALRNAKSEKYLIEDYTLTYAPSASVLGFLHGKETPVDGGALVLGDPDSPLPLRKLPGAEEEARLVAGKLGTEARIGADARESLLYRLGGKVDLVHLAAHGIYDPANPLFSRIALAAGDTHDGSLTVHEILSTLDLSGTNLVVLSACRSAVGARSGGDEVVGLTRALLYAGTPGVLSTLWNIDDASSAGFMDEFYRRLTGGSSAAEALRDAQLTLIKSELHSHPRYWAAFTLNGDPQGRWKNPE
jgi:CHAT domain-containing protein/tetratricopeptide (TPR) repeat protein